jgi:hypothetical protein
MTRFQGERAMARDKQDNSLNNPLAEGLIDFYSSQVDVMLSQYENINHLLGPTHDWTHPGTHCEILLREFLRRNLLQWMNVDKGYIYGRATANGSTSHCPEIDILIHDVRRHAPIFRLGDLVIVEPESVIGIIQVKRSFKTVGDSKPLDKGLQQVIGAKQHLFDMIHQKRLPQMPELSLPDFMRPVFSAVVAFDNVPHQSFKDELIARFDNHKSEQRYPETLKGFDDDTPLNHCASLFVLPTFVGSLTGSCAVAHRRSVKQMAYSVYQADSGGKKMSLQLMLYNFMSHLFEHVGDITRPFAFPKLTSVTSFTIPER